MGGDRGMKTDENLFTGADSIEFSPTGIHIHQDSETVIISWNLWQQIEEAYEEQEDF